MTECAFLIVGGGIAGASAGYELAARGTTILLERESQPGYHSTGRSAALYTENYGNAVARGLTMASRGFFEDPPDGFTEYPLLTPRGTMMIGRADQRASFEQVLAEGRSMVDSIEEISLEEARTLCPALDPDYVASAMFEPAARDMDVHAIHQGFLKGFRARGGQLVTDAEVTALERKGGLWRVVSAAGEFRASVLVNAAGAWSDRVAALAGVEPVGLVPKRRTAFTFDAPAGVAVDAWPAVIDVEEGFYFKPDAGRVLGSPADETPVEPQDVQPEEMDIAVAVDRIERASTLKVPRLANRWAGLRSFVADKTPVVGFAAEAESFLWLAGQGGFGIMTSPAMGRTAAALADGEDLPADVRDMGVRAADLAPERLRDQPSATA